MAITNLIPDVTITRSAGGIDLFLVSFDLIPFIIQAEVE